jgi:hypothetical protein
MLYKYFLDVVSLLSGYSSYIRGSSVNELLLLNPPISSTAIWMDEYTANQALLD